MNASTHVMIVTGEASGDLHGSRLVEALRRRRGDIHFCGMGGPELEAAGVEILFDAKKISVMGIIEVIAHGPDIFRAQRILRRRLKESRPDLLIIIDLPDFNLLLAKAAKRLGIPVYYYICPQIWAWRTSRVKTLRQRVDGLGVILPFEEPFYRRYGIDAHYVGHPLLDSVRVEDGRGSFLIRHGLDSSRKIIGLLPGSRRREIFSLLPVFLEAAALLQKKFSEPITFFLPQAATISTEDLLQAGVSRYQNVIDIQILEGKRYDAMSACNAVVAASGTVTLELSLLKVPMVVTYRLAPLTYLLGKLLVKLDFFSLVNLVGGRQIVPELLQDEVSPERIATELLPLLQDNAVRRDMLDGLSQVNAALGETGASDRVAEDILALLDRQGRPR